MLFRVPVVTVPIIAEAFRVFDRSARPDIGALVRAGVLEDVPETTDRKSFAALVIHDTVDRTPGRHARSAP